MHDPVLQKKMIYVFENKIHRAALTIKFFAKVKYLLGTFRFFQMIKGRLKHRQKEDDSVIVATSFCDTNIYSLKYHKNLSRTNL